MFPRGYGRRHGRGVPVDGRGQPTDGVWDVIGPRVEEELHKEAAECVHAVHEGDATARH